MVFDWFSEYVKVIEKVVVVYSDHSCDDEVLLLALKLCLELSDNSSNRLKFDTWSINGLIIFKEVSSLLSQLLMKYDHLSEQGKLIKKDIYVERLKYIKRSVAIVERFVLGNYINFAMCEYYDDHSFSTLAQAVF